ncbi:MAG: HU family DNA-binding protein [Ignavibacteria bacterium]
MITLELINKIAELNNLTKGRAEMIVNTIVESITEKIKSEKKISIPNFGIFEVITGETASGKQKDIYVSFKPEQAFLNIVNS